MPNRQELIHIARTVLAVLIGLAPSAPELVDRLGLSTSAGVGGAAVLLAATLVRVTQIPIVNARLKAWLKY